MTSRHPVSSCHRGRCDLVVAIYGDHAVYGASDAEEADDPRFWQQLSSTGEAYALFHAHDVPEEIAADLVAQGTSNQTFHDGYQAYHAVKPYLHKAPFYYSHEYDVHAGPHDPLGSREYEDNPRGRRAPSAGVALVRASGMNDLVVSVHRTVQAAEAAMRKHGGEPNSMFTSSYRVAAFGPGTGTELIDHEGVGGLGLSLRHRRSYDDNPRAVRPAHLRPRRPQHGLGLSLRPRRDIDVPVPEGVTVTPFDTSSGRRYRVLDGNRLVESGLLYDELAATFRQIEDEREIHGPRWVGYYDNPVPMFNLDDIRDAKGKSYMLRYLPYTETPDGRKSETIIGYRKRGYGYGRNEEFFRTQAEADDRMAFLTSAGVVEEAEIRKEVPGQGMVTTLIAEWKDETQYNDTKDEPPYDDNPRRQAKTPVSGPQYEPHGGRCEFLGRRRDYDLYVCTYEGYIDTVIARYGNELEDYKSGLVFALRGLDPDLVDALRRAKERGFEIQAGRFRDDR